MTRLIFSRIIFFIIFSMVPFAASAQTSSVFPVCGKQSGLREKFGFRFGIRVPKGSKFKRGGDVDFSSIWLSFGNKSRRVWMTGMSGANATSGEPNTRLTSSERFEKTLWTSGEIKGVDYRGVSKDGTRWRYLGFFGEAIWYNDMSTEESAFFDKVFDDLCFYSER